MAARLNVQVHRHLPTLLLCSWLIRRQLRATAGLVGYALSLDPRRGTLWIVSAWTSRADLGRFDRSPLHATVKATMRPTLVPSTFAVWRCTAAELPIRWDEVRKQIVDADLRRRRSPDRSPGPA